MSFSGDLEHLPIVDVIQLMHSTRNSGILEISGRKGKSQLVFKNGYIVGACHLNNGIRIGDILVSQGAINEATLQEALEIQHTPGSNRKPLIVTLLEGNLVDEQQAYTALKSLIELTLIEILTWRKGIFTLEASDEVSSDEFKYYPNEIEREINVDVQGILMNALRIFDEKVRDGEIALEEENDTGEEITADLLGLDELERLERKIPGVYQGLGDPSDTGLRPPAKKRVSVVRRLNDFIAGLPDLTTPQSVARAVLSFIGELLPRALILVARGNELIADRACGISCSAGDGIDEPLGFQIPLDRPSLLQQAIASGSLYCGPCADEVVELSLYRKIGAPADSTVLLLPVKRHGKPLFLIYADFGTREQKQLPVELLDMLAEQAGLRVDALH
jgi:hypothetical protein